MIYLTSDYHFFHNKEFVYKFRGFNSVEEMNEKIVENHNNVVRPQDDVYILGDLLLGGADNLDEGIELLEQLNGKIHLVRGNHDTDRRWRAYQTECNWNLVEAKNSIYLKYGKQNFYLSHFPSLTSNYDNDKPLRQRLLNICGHTHTLNKWADADKGYTYHVEVDSHNCMPVSIEQIIKDFKEKYRVKQKCDNRVKQNCDKCVWQYNGCPASNNPVNCPNGLKFKRDPPDGGYYG